MNGVISQSEKNCSNDMMFFYIYLNSSQELFPSLIDNYHGKKIAACRFYRDPLWA